MKMPGLYAVDRGPFIARFLVVAHIIDMGPTMANMMRDILVLSYFCCCCSCCCCCLVVVVWLLIVWLLFG